MLSSSAMTCSCAWVSSSNGECLVALLSCHRALLHRCGATGDRLLDFISLSCGARPATDEVAWSEMTFEDPDATVVFDDGEVAAQFEIAGERLNVDVDVGSNGFRHARIEFEVAEVVEQFGRVVVERGPRAEVGVLKVV